MPLQLTLFLFGLLVSLIVMMGLVPVYLVAYLDQARREGFPIPGAVRRLGRLFGLEDQDDPPTPGRSEPKP